MLSVVIPAKNEEEYLPRLLESLEKQTFKNFEVIVADAKSTDKTREIAKAFGARVVEGGLPGVGRNAGAAVAKGEDILFLDADVVLPSQFLAVNYGLFKWKAVDCATTLMKPLSRKLEDRLIHAAWNVSYRVFERVRPVCTGFHIFVRRELFEKVGGFEEKMQFCEDLDFVKRACKGNKFRVLPVPVLVSVRRLEKEGRLQFCLKGVFGFAHLVLNRHRNPLFKYEFGHEAYDAAEELEVLEKKE